MFKYLRDHRAYCYTAEVLTRKLFRTIVFDFRDWNNITITKPRGNIFVIVVIVIVIISSVYIQTG